MMGSGWQNVLSPQCGQGVKQIQMVLGRPKSFRISSSSVRHWASLLVWMIPWELKLSWGTVYSSPLKLGSPEVCRSIFSMIAMERRFPHMLKYLSWEQWLRAGRMASRWKSLIPHMFKSSFSSVPATFSSRTWRSSARKLVKVTPFRFRPFSWQMFQHWDRWVKSDSVSRQLVIEMLYKEVFRHLEGKKRKTSN